MTTPNYPTWDQRDAYLAQAEAGMDKVRADLAVDTTNVWQSIDATITALHELRNAAGSEQRKRHDAMVARMEAEAAARAARPADPSPEVVEKAREWIARGYPVLARCALRDHTSMSDAAISEFVERLAGSREEVPT